MLHGSAILSIGGRVLNIYYIIYSGGFFSALLKGFLDTDTNPKSHGSHKIQIY